MASPRSLKSRFSRLLRRLDKSGDDNNAAYDAVIAAVGIVAVLVANVAYVHQTVQASLAGLCSLMCKRA